MKHTHGVKPCFTFIFCFNNLKYCLENITEIGISLENESEHVYLWLHNVDFCTRHIIVRSLVNCDWLSLIPIGFLAFDYCRFCVVIRFFHPRHNGQWPPTSKDFYPRFYPLHVCPILILQEEPVFPLLKLSFKQGHYWYHFDNVFDMTWFLTVYWTRYLLHSKPALYRGAAPVVFLFLFFWRSTFVGSTWSFVFSSLPQLPMTSDFEGFSIPGFIHYIYFPILILEKEPVFSLLNVEC